MALPSFWPASFWPAGFWPAGFWPSVYVPPSGTTVPDLATIADGDWVFFLTVRVGVTAFDSATDGDGATRSNVWAYYTGPATSEEPAGDGDAETVTTRRVWHLRVSTLNPVRITRRAKITEANGTVWVVDKFQLQTFGTRYRCECVKAL